MRLFDADELIEKIRRDDSVFICKDGIYWEIYHASIIKAEPVRHGKWIWDDEGYHCSECWYHAQGNTLECMDGTFRFCPICGAKMEVVDDETN